jgi:hypothetical protein
MKFYLIVPRRENRHYCTAVLLPSSVPPRGTSPDPPVGRGFSFGVPGYEIFICFKRESVIKYNHDAAGHGVMSTP